MVSQAVERPWAERKWSSGHVLFCFVLLAAALIVRHLFFMPCRAGNGAAMRVAPLSIFAFGLGRKNFQVSLLYRLTSHELFDRVFLSRSQCPPCVNLWQTLLS